LNILSTPIDDGACGLYRVSQPLKRLENLYNDVRVDFLTASHSANVVQKAIEMTDIIVVRQDKSKFIPHIKEMQMIYAKNGAKLPVKIVFDHDDNLFDVNPFNDSYRYSGLSEVKMSDVMDETWMEQHPNDKDEYLWKNGRDDFDLKRNQDGADRLIQNLKNSDMITAPNKKLCALYSMMSGVKKTAVLPNCVDFTHFMKDVGLKKKGIRVGWQGGSSHFVDYMSIRDDIFRIAEREDATYVHIGQQFQDMRRIGCADYNDWVPTPAHPYRLALMNLDLAVIPLAHFEFNYYKSDIKFVELSALKIPSVVANCEPYSDIVEHGVTGFLYNDIKEMDFYLTELIRNTKLREKVGQNAFEWCYENRNADKQAHLWKEAYDLLA
jgi:hypothetical protein